MKKKEIDRDSLERIIESYFDDVEAEGQEGDAAMLLGYISEALQMPVSLVEKQYGKIVKAAVKFDKNSYLKACDEKFYSSELKKSFNEFCKDKFARALDESQDSLLNELQNDAQLSTFRKTTTYRNADQSEKYRMLWRYLVKEFGTRIDDEDTLSDLCMEIAMQDENRF